MTGNELRAKFLDYFAANGHAIVKSDILVPRNDPSLLFTNAGMVQFKNLFLGQETRGYTRAATAQKCVRAGGKHNDLEMVGRTARHHTFFEMLGNFSFGDYFKREAIKYAWEFLTVSVGLPKDRLYASIYQDDDEAFRYWNTDIGLAPARIFRLGEKDNFWAMGNTGPCGPCSEIYIDQGDKVGCGRPACAVGCDCDRFLEIWNLVFMQYDRDESGKMTPLPKPCIDTGMGLERLAAVAQGQQSNYDSDLITGIIGEVCRITGTTYRKNPENDVSVRVIADHSRAVTFLINDGVLPSNEGRGYVLRRILRRALRHGKMLGKTEPFLHLAADEVIRRFQDTYPELDEHHAYIKKVILNEEESFRATLNFGTQRLDEILDRVKKTGASALPGDEIFKLYDTYGFPVDLVEDIARENALTLDMDGYNNAMREQREKSMQSWKGSGEKEVAAFYRHYLQKSPATVFEGYKKTKSESRITAIVKNGAEAESAGTGESVELLFANTPFYGESGGQVGDTGRAFNAKAGLVIENTAKAAPELTIHHARVTHGSIKKGDTLTLEVDAEKRQNTALNHTATHLLHAALKQVLGDHVKQAGSLVTPERLRFDYTHFAPLAETEKSKLETIVNEQIRLNTGVTVDELQLEEALQRGATALFGEKYGAEVRMVAVADFSKELCGGTHIRATGDIGLFKIVSEGGIASGVRRIEAVTGAAALEKMQKETELLNAIRAALKTPQNEELNRLQKLYDRTRELEKEIESLKAKLISGKGQGGQDAVTSIGGVAAVIKKLDSMDAKTLRLFIDNTKDRIKSGVVVVGSNSGEKVLLAAGVTSDLISRFHAGNILKEIAQIVGGNGGGRPDFAQAGGTKPELLDQALEKAARIIESNAN